MRSRYAASCRASSPLTRGKRDAHTARVQFRRLIPAHAGKTSAVTSSPCRPWAHPHSRGENFASVLMLRSTVGASPLTQGKRHDPDHHSASTVLPRSHGENKQLLVAAASQRGSSPLTRGKRDRLRELRLELGLIPAHTGKTVHRERSISLTRAHPHSRGENETQEANASVDAGSSPLTRGKRRCRAAYIDGVRLIPAHAGKTCAALLLRRWRPAHPRSRGENDALGSGRILLPGSSPLTRGKRCGLICQQRLRRLIPAHAGKTSPSPSA